MRKLTTLLMLVFILCAFTYSGYCSSELGIPDEVRNAAEKGLEIMKKEMAAAPSQWGYESVSEVKEITLGEGFLIHFVDQEKLQNASGESLLELAVPADQWQFIVYLKNEPKTILTVGYENGECRLIHFSGSNNEFGKGIKNYSKLISEKGKKVEPIVVKSGPAYYLIGKIGKQEYILPTAPQDSAKSINGGIDYTGLRSSSEVVEHLKDIKKNTIPKVRGGSAVAQANSLEQNIPNANNIVPFILFCFLTGSVIIFMVHLRYGSQVKQK